MNKEENYTYIEVINNNGDIKLTKLRNPQAIWQNNDYPDEFVFKDVDYVNIFQLIQENQQLKEIINKIKELMDQDQCAEYCYMDVADYLLELEKGDSND